MHTFPASFSAPVTYQPTILIVEDNPEDLYYLATSLQLFDCNFIAADNAMTALSAAQREQPDLILLDIRLPHINGIELLNILRTDWLTRNIPVVAVTGLAEADEQRRIADVGFDCCLIKPYLLEDLRNVIDIHVHRLSSGLAS